MNPEILFSSRNAWREWLKTNHKIKPEVWFVYYKKHSGKSKISYHESVEEAICFGWIDGIKKRIDDEKYTHRFTPRKPKSKWSSQNIETARKLIDSGKMAASGLKAFNERIEYNDHQLRAVNNPKLSPETESKLKSNSVAWQNFCNLTPGYRKQYVLWLETAKKSETRIRRLNEAILLLEKNKKLGMK